VKGWVLADWKVSVKNLGFVRYETFVWFVFIGGLCLVCVFGCTNNPHPPFPFPKQKIINNPPPPTTNILNKKLRHIFFKLNLRKSWKIKRSEKNKFLMWEITLILIHHHQTTSSNQIKSRNHSTAYKKTKTQAN